MTNSYIALDLETTGLEARLDKITEIAALESGGTAGGGKVCNPGESWAAAGGRITVHGVTDDMVKDAPAIEGYDWRCGPVWGIRRYWGIIYCLITLSEKAAVNSGLDFERGGH